MSTTQTHVNRRRAQRAEALQNQRARQQAAAARREREAQQREESTIMARTPRGNRRVSRDSFYGRRAVAQEAASASDNGNAARTTQPSTTSTASASDSVQLSSTAQTSNNPFEGYAQGSSNVTVQSGDTLSALLMRQGYSESELYGDNGALAQVMRANPSLRNPDLIFPDQQLKLPSRGESGSTSAASTAAQPSNGNSVSEFLQQLTPQQGTTSTQQQVPQNLDWLYLGQNYGNSTPDYSTSSFFA